MDTLHPLVLIFLHQVGSLSCRHIIDFPPYYQRFGNPLTLPQIRDYSLEDNEPKLDDIRNLLRVVPYQHAKKWRTDDLRGLPVNNQKANPIALILAPSEVSGKFKKLRKSENHYINKVDLHKKIEPIHKQKENVDHTQQSHDKFKESEKNVSDIIQNNKYETYVEAAKNPSDRVKLIESNEDSDENASFEVNSSKIENNKMRTNHNLFLDVESRRDDNNLTNEEKLKIAKDELIKLIKENSIIVNKTEEKPAKNDFEKDKEQIINSKSIENKDHNKIYREESREKQNIKEIIHKNDTEDEQTEVTDQAAVKKENLKDLLALTQNVRDSTDSQEGFGQGLNDSEETLKVSKETPVDDKLEDDDKGAITYGSKEEEINKVRPKPAQAVNNIVCEDDAAKKRKDSFTIYNLSFLFHK